MRSLVVAVLVAVPYSAFADDPCAGLTASQKAVVDQVFSSQHPYDECDRTFAECLQARPVAPLVQRLAAWICRKARAGQDAKAIARSLEKRGLSMLRSGKTSQIDLSSAPKAGCAKAKVQVVLYVCARCPYCARLLPALYREVAGGRLSGKVALYYRLFPIKAHEYSTEANLAVAAATRLGKGWEYLLKAYERFDAFSLDALSQWASEVGLEKEVFEKTMKEAATRDALVESKKEGLRNGVDATPTVFISARRWQGDLDVDTLIDAIEEEVEALE